jgi:hypothetical protein
MSDTQADRIDEELTAYLDGELSPELSADLERKLVEDESLRKRLADLRKAYDLLDDLPQAAPRQSFTQTTIEMVVADLRRSSENSALGNSSLSNANHSPNEKGTDDNHSSSKKFGDKGNGKALQHSESTTQGIDWFTWPRSAFVATVAGLLGVFLGTLLVVFQSRFELSQLDLAANIPGLQDAAELSVVSEIAQEKELIEYLRSHYYDRMIPLVPKSLWGRRNWVHSLNAVQIAKLDSTRELLGKFPGETRNRWEAIQTQLDSSPNADHWNQTVRVIGMVLDSMPTAKRQDLESLNSSEQRIRFLKEQLSLRAAMFYAAELQSDDSNTLEEWSKNQLLPSIFAAMPFLRRETDVKTAMMALNSTRPIEDGFRLADQDEIVAELANQLSSFPKKLLEGIDRNDQLLVLSTWMVPEGMNSNSRLVESYERMRREVRDEIDLADPNDFRRLLRERSRRNGNANRNPR